MAKGGKNHILPEGRTKPQKGQQVELQQTDQITYILRVEQGHRRSTGEIVANRSDHIHAEGGRRPQKGQQVELQQTDQITYILRVKESHKRVSRWNCSKQTR
jgi:hypothetical protein